MGDVFFNGIFPFIDLSSGGSIQGMIRGVDAALRMTNTSNQNRAGARTRATTHRAAGVQIHAGDDRADCAERDEGRPEDGGEIVASHLPRHTAREWRARKTGSSSDLRQLPNDIFTIGYEGTTVDGFVAALKAAGSSA